VACRAGNLMVKFINDILFGIGFGVGFFISYNVLNFIASMMHANPQFHLGIA
jgi:hypothetical protein